MRKIVIPLNIDQELLRKVDFVVTQLKKDYGAGSRSGFICKAIEERLKIK